jgi:hypothetical protein
MAQRRVRNGIVGAHQRETLPAQNRVRSGHRSFAARRTRVFKKEGFSDIKCGGYRVKLARADAVGAAFILPDLTSRDPDRLGVSSGLFPTAFGAGGLATPHNYRWPVDELLGRDRAARRRKPSQIGFLVVAILVVAIW